MTTLNKTTRTRTSLVVLYSQNYAAGIRGHYHEASDCFEYLPPQKKSPLKSSHPKNTCQIFLPKINPGVENFKPKIILRSSPSLEIRSTPLGLFPSQLRRSNFAQTIPPATQASATDTKSFTLFHALECVRHFACKIWDAYCHAMSRVSVSRDHLDRKVVYPRT